MVTPISPIQTAYNPIPVANQTTKPRQGVFYAFDLELANAPTPTRPGRIGLFDWMLHPLESYQLYTKLGRNPQSRESFGTRLAMYRDIQKSLSRKGNGFLYQQLKQGRLTDTKADDNRSTVAHLYNMATTARHTGFDNAIILEDTLRLLSQPQTITQKFGTLKPESLQGLQRFYSSGLGPKISQPIDMNTLKVTSSATCVASSLMYYMAHRNPSEFVRHIAELTSPRLAFQEKAWLNEISPEDPSQAARKLQEYGIPATAVPGTNGAQYWIKADLPYSGVIRALNQQGKHEVGARGVVESAYQAALTHLVVRSYDPGLDMRVNPDGTLDPSKGLEEDRKTLMESIIKDNGGIMSVTYQFTASNRENEPYLMGYYRNFESTTKDLMKAVDSGEDVIIGITDTDGYGTTGRINMGHELTVTKYRKDKKTGEIIFTVADSDDNVSKLVERRASEIVPRIHHAGFPVKQAQTIWSEINARGNNRYLIPDQTDSQRYKLVNTVPANQQEKFLAEYQKILSEQDTQVAQQQPAQPQVQQPQPQVAQSVPQARPNYYYPGSYYPGYYPQPVAPVAYPTYNAAAYYGNYGYAPMPAYARRTA
jgi:hypothetical protein